MNVNWLKVCKIGLEVLLAVGTGLAVFAGVSRAVNDDTNTIDNNNRGNKGNAFVAPTSGEQVSNDQPSETTNSSGNKVAISLRATQNSMEKMITVINSIAMVAECLGMVFGKTADRGYNQPSWYNSCNGGWMTQTQPAYSGYGLRQVTPFVQEVGYYPTR